MTLFQYKKPKRSNNEEYTNDELADMHQPFELVALKSRDHSKKDILLWSRLRLQRVYDSLDDGFKKPNWSPDFVE